MNFRPLVLPLFLGAGFCSIYFLPRTGGVANSAIAMELPKESGNWMLKPTSATKLEIETLGADTKFSKADCYAARAGEYNEDGYLVPDLINLSIVLSGYDLNNSIHRPERCMPAQGHKITGADDVKIELKNGHHFEAKRLLSVRRDTVEDSKVTKEWKCITYYFFVGHDQVTNDHLERTLLDIKDRLVRGMDQRWAYASATIYYGFLPWIPDKEISEEEADQKLRDFVAKLAEKQINWEQIAP
jgi:hypothetical protein